MDLLRKSLTWLVIAVIPVALGAQWLHVSAVMVFVLSAVAVLPVAAWIGRATENLAHRMGPTYGALFNATFGNFAEMVIALLAVRAGLPGVVKASFTGSIVGNILFVGGLSMLFGGWRRKSQTFSPLAAESQGGQLFLAVAALIVPALFFQTASEAHHPELIHQVSISTSIVLLVAYFGGLWFTFRTHRDSFANETTEGEAEWSVTRSLVILLGSSVLMGVLAEGLVHAVEAVGHRWGMNEVFLGFIVIAIVGNAAEHSTAVLLAIKNRMDTALNISMQSSVQIALFVTPVIVFASYALGHPLDLVFTRFEMLAVILAVVAFAYLLLNGETNWFEGLQLLALYAIIAIALYFLPVEGPAAAAAAAH